MPKRREISSEVRSQAIGLHRGGTSLQKIGSLLSLPHSTVQSIINRWKFGNTINNKMRSGRPKLVSLRGIRNLKRIVRKSRWSTLRNITSEFRNAIGTNVSINTVRRRLHDIGFSSRIPARKPFISEKNRLKRLAFFHKYKNWGADEWHNVIWFDERRFKLFHSDERVRVWRQQKERFINECIRTTVKWGGGSVMVWACFFGDTLGPCYPITNTMNSSSYITNILKPFHSTFYLNILENHPKLVFQQDNALPHVSGITRSWFAQKNYFNGQLKART